MPSPSKQIVKRFLNDLWSKGNLAVADEIIAANYVQHDPATPNFGKGPEAAKQIVTLYRSAFPDLHFTIDQIVDGDDFVTTRYTASGTHKAELRGIAATNKTVKVEGIFISRISRGKMAETWAVWDALGLMQQLGQVPAFEKAKAQVAE